MFKPLRQFVQDRFGSKRGALRYATHKALRCIGRYRKPAPTALSRVRRLVFICSGNICRSPLGEAIARREGFPAVSFGLNCRGGDPADPRAKDYAARSDASLESHSTRHIADYQPEPGDLLVCMEPGHTQRLPKSDRKPPLITLAGLWVRPAAPYLHDPFMSNDTYFRHCERTVENATLNLIDAVREHHA